MRKAIQKIVVLIVAVMLLLSFLTACEGADNQNNYNSNLNRVNTYYMDINQTLAFTAYMSGDLLERHNHNAILSPFYAVHVIDIEDNQPMEIEEEMEQINFYFNKLKLFLDAGRSEPFNFDENSSDRVEYDNMLKFNVYGRDYSIYYNYLNLQENVRRTPYNNRTETDLNDNFYDDRDLYGENIERREQKEFQLSGIIVIDEIEYDLKGANEIEGDEQKLWLETTYNDNTDDFIRMERRTEDNEQKYHFKSFIDNQISESRIELENNDSEEKIEMYLISGEDESKYEFKKEIENGIRVYKFEYRINNVEGQGQITEGTDGNGNTVYRYSIRENGRNKDIFKDRNNYENIQEDSDEDNIDEIAEESWI